MNRRQGAKLRLSALGAAVTALLARLRSRLPTMKRGRNRRRFGRKLAPTDPRVLAATDSSLSTRSTPTSGLLSSGLARADADGRVRPRGVVARLRHLGSFLGWGAPLAVALLAFALPVLGVRAYEYVMSSGYFHVREVVIDGAARIPKDKVLEIAGIVPGTHLLEADLGAMEDKLRADPWIRSARVESILPDTLVVHLVEHRPTAFLAAGDLYLVDENATPFMLAPVSEDLALPVITGLSPEQLTDPKESQAVHHALTGALNVSRIWADQGLAARYPLGEIRIDGPRGYVVVVEAQNQQGVGTGQPIEIVLGRGPFTEKLYRLEWVLEHLHAQGKSPEYVLLDLLDGSAPASAEALGGARVVVKAEVDPEDSAETVAPLVDHDAAQPEPIEPAPAPRRRPARAAPPRPARADAGDVVPPPGDATDEDVDDASPELVPLSGGRPAAEPGLEE